jgi:DNA-binding response OmpR family regulator
MGDALRLFLIEDDDDIALVVRKGLERHGHQVTRCRSAADALIVLGHTPFDLVILDQVLPDASGTDLLRTLARKDLRPVLMVTAHGDGSWPRASSRPGALDYLVKDEDLGFLNELPKRVAESVNRHRLQNTNLLLIEAPNRARQIFITDLASAILHLNRAGG